MKRKIIKEWVDRLMEPVTGFIPVAFMIIAILAVINGYRYFEFRQEDPNFCVSCHPMKDAFQEWQHGKHRDIVCQRCHQLSMLEQNRLLVAFVMSGNQKGVSHTHDRERPWEECNKCHMNSSALRPGNIRKSYGHVVHVLVQNISCIVCHKGSNHNFRPKEDVCIGCHKDKVIHGTGMEALSCLKCHSYAEKAPSMAPQDRCVKCHASVSARGPMSGLLCHSCHKPHGKIIPSSSICSSECHKDESSIGQHGLHKQKGLNCLDCHKAHNWKIGKDRAAVLCSRCHSDRNPALFIF